jgi:hypothetical protein
VTNWTKEGVDHYYSDHQGKRIGGDGTPPFRRRIDQIILHETVGWRFIGAGKHLSVHFSIGPDGVVYQHNDIAQVLAHAGSFNGTSVGIELTNWSLFHKNQVDPASGKRMSEIIGLTPTNQTGKIISAQTGAIVSDADITEDKERIQVAWVDGRLGDFFYVIPYMKQFEAAYLLVKWLCSGGSLSPEATFLVLQESWRQRVGDYFVVHQNPRWITKPPLDLVGIFAHTNISADRGDGGVLGLYAWLRAEKRLDMNAANTTCRALISGTSHVAKVKLGNVDKFLIDLRILP